MNEDPISVSASIANIIDCTSVSDENENETAPYISNILIAPPSDTNDNTPTIDCNADNLIRLCEELSYLDVPGPTIKSRLIVSTLNNNEDVIEECLQIGINKYILDTLYDVDDLDDRLMSLRKVVEEEGKELILTDV
jgi:DNA-binding NarL/FixJ family response regulator